MYTAHLETGGRLKTCVRGMFFILPEDFQNGFELVGKFEAPSGFRENMCPGMFFVLTEDF